MLKTTTSWRRLTQWCVIAVVIAVAGATSRGDDSSAPETLIVVSSQSNAFTRAADRCAEVLRDRPDTKVRVVMLDQFDNSTLGSATDVVTIGARASSRVAKEAPPSTRLYYCMTPSPDRLGLTDRPMTSGASADAGIDDQIRWIQSVVPTAKRIGALHRSSSPRSTAMLGEFASAIPADWTLVPVDLDRVDSISEGIAELLTTNIDLVWTIPDPKVYDLATVKALLLESIRSKTPVYGFSTSLVRAGALLGVGVDPVREGERVAQMALSREMNTHVDAEPIEAINTIVAERIDIRIPKKTVRNADMTFDGK